MPTNFINFCSLFIYVCVYYVEGNTVVELLYAVQPSLCILHTLSEWHKNCVQYTVLSSIWFWILGWSLVVKISWCADSGRAALYYEVQDMHKTSWSSGSMPTSKSRVLGFTFSNEVLCSFPVTSWTFCNTILCPSFPVCHLESLWMHLQNTTFPPPQLLTWMFVFICVVFWWPAAVTTGCKIVDSRDWATQCCFHTVYF
jgi:hypothetical protein